MSEVRDLKLGDLIDTGIADLQTGPFGTMLNASEYSIDGIPVIAVQDIGDNKLEYHKFVYVPSEVAARLKKYRVQLNDIVFGRKGAIDRRALIKKSEEGWLQGSDCIRLRLDESINSKFISYQLGTQYIKEWLFQHSTGATMPSLNQEILRQLPLRIPSSKEQESIASVLSSLDDKIDLLHRQNKTLEQMAETLFRQWIVEGKEDSIIRDEFYVTMGQSPPGDSYNENQEGILFFQGRTDFGFRFPAPRIYCSAPTRFAEKYDTLMSVRAPVGDLNYAEERCCIGRGLAAISHKNKRLHHSYAYYTFKFLKNDFDIHEDSGTIFGSINKDELLNIKCPKIGIEKIEFYNKEIGLLDDKLVLNCKQIKKLEQLRDSLLPKLMNGSIRVINQ